MCKQRLLQLDHSHPPRQTACVHNGRACLQCIARLTVDDMQPLLFQT